MATVKITSQLHQKLESTNLKPDLLIRRFSDWKDQGEDSSYWFGQDKTDPKTELSHAHMAPVTSGPPKDEWDSFWRKKQVWRRRSDCYVLYVHHKRLGYLLIDVLFDPGAHSLWMPASKQLLENYEIVADNFLFNGTVP